MLVVSGPLYNMGKGRDHEIVRTFKLMDKFKIEFYVVTGPQVCEDARDLALNWMLFHYHPFYLSPCTHKL